MALLPNPLKATLNQAKQLLTKTVSETQVVGSLNQTMDQMSGAAKSFASKFNTQIPGLDMNLLGLDFPVPPPPLQDIGNKQGKQVKELSPDITFPLKNPLHQYASYNYIWTLSVLSPYDFNFPDLTYKKGIIHDIIIKSGSGNPDDRPALTPYAVPPGNPTGKYDFFIENARITGVIGLEKNTGNTNSTGLTFTVVEPYSIGLFFQSLSVAALKNGYKNWIEMPVLLTLEFFGHMDFENQGVTASKVATKHFPMKLTELDMKVGTEGSKYECTAVPWNELAFSKQISTVKSDIQIEGATVQEMLQKGPKSLQVIMNNALKEQAKKQKLKVADQILILFPVNADSLKGNYTDTDSKQAPSATVDPSKQSNNADILRQLNVEKAADGYNLEQKTNINALGRAPLGYNAGKKDRASFGKDGEVWDEKKQVYVRGSVAIKSNSGEASFKSGTDVPTIINQILLGSDYGRNALQNLDSDGYVNWWRIDTQIYIIKNDSNMLVSGRYPTIRVFRVLPHLVHHSRFLKPDQTPKGMKKLKEQAVKDYEYIYTGKNIEIINFSIGFKSGFYNSLSADSGKSNIDVKRRNQQADVAADSKKENNQPTTDQEPINPILEDDNLKTPNMTDQLDVGANSGGPLPDDPATLAARQFHNAITRGGDMIELNMTILGDPFYLGDSGMGNYTAQDSNKKGINSDLAINYQQGEVYVNVRFRNPVDINHETGAYDFGSPIVPQFSGLYRVLQVENTFDKGMFTQNLLMYRMLNQDIDSKGDPFEGKEAEALANGLMPI